MQEDRTIEIVEWLIKEAATVRAMLREEHKMLVLDLPKFKGKEDLFADILQEQLVIGARTEALGALELNWEEAAVTIDWPTLQRVWHLDVYGSNI